MTNDSLFKLFMLPSLSEIIFFWVIPLLLHGSLNERRILWINEDSEDRFNSKMKLIIKLSVIFYNQTERIILPIHRFVATNQSYLRKLVELKTAFSNKKQIARAWIQEQYSEWLVLGFVLLGLYSEPFN